VQQDSEGVSLEQVLGVLRRRLPLIVLCVVIVAGAAYAFSKRETKKYTATASVVFNINPLSEQIAGLPAVGSSSSTLVAQQADNLELVKGGDTTAKTASVLGRGLTAEKVSGSLKIASEGESGVIDISATSTSPALAAAIANTYAQQFVSQQQSANRQYFKSALALVRKQLARLPPRQRVSADGVELEDRAQTLGLLAELNYGNVQVAQEALPPTSPSSPKTSKNTALGAFLGLVLGLGLAFVLERFDRRIRRPEDLEKIYRLPLLGTVPKSAAFSRSTLDENGKLAALPPLEAEAFSLIRAHLRFFNIDRELHTIAIASAALGDGKTTTARHLAEATARMGSRVLLVEVDLRDPTLAQELNVSSGPGLADVLIDTATIGQVIQSVALAMPPGKGVGERTLDVLVAGAVLPPNPTELLESHAMNALLERTRSAYDLVVIDTPPLTAVSDAFPLLNRVDGVIIVGWVGRSRRDAAEQLHQTLASSGAPLLGVVVNGYTSKTSTIYTATDRYQIPSTPTPNGTAASDELTSTAST
jgi:succinoglycan biosynthesis transport protein ExoP